METIFKKLTELIKTADNVMIMTHHHSDLDALGSSLCLGYIINHLEKQNWLVFNQKDNNLSIEKSLEMIKKSKLKINFIDQKKAEKHLKENTLLIILDTSKKELVEYPELLKIKNKIILDHHPIGNKNITDTVLSYVNSNLSSTNEIMTEYLKYLDIAIPPIIATIMLAGVEVDTNSYGVKTTAKTFETAAFLLNIGALNTLKHEILKEDKDQYLKREKLLEKSYIVREYAICKVEKRISKEDLAVLAEKMLLFDKVEAAFALGKMKKNLVAISGRSLGETNVYQIMKKFDGGGHLTEAAAQIKNVSLEDLEKKLKKELGVIK